MNKKKLALIFCVILLTTSCGVEEFESFVINFNANEISFECSNNFQIPDDDMSLEEAFAAYEEPQFWEIDINFDLGTGDYSKKITEDIRQVDTIVRILLTPRELTGYNEDGERVFEIQRESLGVRVFEDGLTDYGLCKIIDHKLKRKF